MAWLQHHLNQAHLYCRFRSWGLPKGLCLFLAAALGRATKPLIYPEATMNPKPWWLSKTLWTNGLAGLALIIQALQGAPWCDPTIQAGALAIINVLLRLITGQPVSTKPGAGVIGVVLAMALVSGCADMTAQQKRQATLIGMEVLAAGVAGMPGTDPTAAYWSKYAAGVLEKGNAANPTATQ